MLLDCATPSYAFATPTPLPLQAAFAGGRLTSDGGLPVMQHPQACVLAKHGLLLHLPNDERRFFIMIPIEIVGGTALKSKLP